MSCMPDNAQEDKWVLPHVFKFFPPVPMCKNMTEFTWKHINTCTQYMHSQADIHTCRLCGSYHENGWEYTWGQMVTSTYHSRSVTHSSSSPSVTAEHWPTLRFPLLTKKYDWELNHRKQRKPKFWPHSIFDSGFVTTWSGWYIVVSGIVFGRKCIYHALLPWTLMRNVNLLRASPEG